MKTEPFSCIGNSVTDSCLVSITVEKGCLKSFSNCCKNSWRILDENNCFLIPVKNGTQLEVEIP